MTARPCAIWFLRHGESVANAAGRFAGQGDDSPLTEKGRTQARQAAHRLPDGLTWIVSSPLRRARESATIVRRIGVRLIDEGFFLDTKEIAGFAGEPAQR